MALPDQTPPNRLSIVEKGGRLVVIDRETGTTPLSAAERMKIWDARFASQTPQQPQERALAPKGATPQPWGTNKTAKAVETQRPALLTPPAKSSNVLARKSAEDIGYGPVFGAYVAVIALLAIILEWAALPIAFVLIVYSLQQGWPKKLRDMLQKLAQQQQSGTSDKTRP